jgi:phenylacetate-CoA ligase
MMYAQICSRVLFPIHETLKGHSSVKLRRSLEQSQWLSPERIRSLQCGRLREFLQTISIHVPYYRDLFKRIGLDANEEAGLETLERIPLLTKQLIREHTQRLRAENAGRLKRLNTGGSTGEPLIFFVGNERVSHDVAAKWRATRWWGVDIGDREIVVWGSPIELGAQDRLRALRDGMFRSNLIPAFDMSSDNLDSYVARIRDLRPRMLFGYPSSLAMIAAHARERGKRMDDLGVEVAFVTSERLYEDQREIISSVFNCRVANGYGGRDAGFIAHECPAGRMHVSAEDIVVEILDESGTPVAEGTSGEIVVTHLCTTDYPFVRYRTGDIGALDREPCPCGRGLPVLREIQGRTTDFVVAQDGTVMHGLALIYPIRELVGIERFQIVQHDRNRSEVLIVPGIGYGEAQAEQIRREFRKRLGQMVSVDVNLVDSIPREASGKYRYVKSAAGPATGELDRRI